METAMRCFAASLRDAKAGLGLFPRIPFATADSIRGYFRFLPAGGSAAASGREYMDRLPNEAGVCATTVKNGFFMRLHRERMLLI